MGPVSGTAEDSAGSMEEKAAPSLRAWPAGWLQALRAACRLPGGGRSGKELDLLNGGCRQYLTANETIKHVISRCTALAARDCDERKGNTTKTAGELMGAAESPR